MKNKSYKWLCIALLLCLTGSLMSSLIQNSFCYVKVEDISMVTGEGTFTGYLLIPESASEKNPAPAVVTSHGYLNNRQMQDITYVELARRGFVVFAMDAYGHGDSSVSVTGDPVMQKSGGMIEAVEYLWALPFVDGSRIGVTGHSMGGGYAEKTVAYYTQLEKEATGASAHLLNKVKSAMIVGNVPLGLLPDGLSTDYSTLTAQEDGYLCEMGTVFARYDEFGMATLNGPVTSMFTLDIAKAMVYMQTNDKSVMSLEAILEGHRYVNSNNGYGIRFYSPYETHPWNHFSTKTASHVIDFFTETLDAPRPMASTNQTWWLKEFFNMAGLIGFFMLIVPLVDVLTGLPFFAGLKADTVSYVPALRNKSEKRRYLTTSIGGVLLSFILYIPLMTAGFMLLVNSFWPQDTTGGIGLWSLVSGLIAVWMVRIGSGKFKGQKEELGLKVGGAKAFFKTVILALFVVSLMYLVVFASDYIFKTDYRIWTFAIRTFSASKIWVAIKYLPFFLVFYIANSLSVTRRRFSDLSETKQIFVSIAWNIAACVLVVAVQYIPVIFTDTTLLALIGNKIGDNLGQLIATGGALFPLLLYPFIPILAIAAVVNIKVYKRTGNIWLAGLINGLLITMLTVANTCFSFIY